VELYAEKVANRGLCAIAQAESLRYKLLGGLAVRRACYGVLRFVMESGAKGCEVVVSGKLRGQRAKSMKFKDGYMVSSGQPVRDYVDGAVRHVLLRQGVLGIQVKIMLDWDPTGACMPRPPAFKRRVLTFSRRARCPPQARTGPRSPCPTASPSTKPRRRRPWTSRTSARPTTERLRCLPARRVLASRQGKGPRRERTCIHSRDCDHCVRPRAAGADARARTVTPISKCVHAHVRVHPWKCAIDALSQGACTRLTLSLRRDLRPCCLRVDNRHAPWLPQSSRWRRVWETSR
jgi:hypothetical protein